MNSLLKLVLSLSLSGSLVIGALLLLKPLVRNRLSRRWQYYIWLVAAARLLLPFTPESSLCGTLFQEPSPETVQISGSDPMDGGLWGEITISPQTEAAPAEPETPRPVEEPPSSGVSPALLAEHLWAVWLLGALLLLVRKITAYQSFVRYARAGREEVSDVAQLDWLARIGEDCGVTRPVELSINRQIASPMLLGFFRPCILIPSELPEPDFRYTILHELTHYRRRDMFYKWLVQIAVCVHWFNPLVWWMARETVHACELACDEAVIRSLDESERRAYGDTLLRAMGTGGRYREALASITLNESGIQLKERLTAIMKFKKGSKLAAVLSALLAAVLLMGAAAAGAYRPDGAAGVPAEVKGGDGSFRYTQRGYYQDGYFFEIGYNVKSSARYAAVEVELPEGGAMDVLYSAVCKGVLKEENAFDALAVLIGRLWRETKDTDFPLERPLVVRIRRTSGEDPVDLAEESYEEGDIAQFSAAFAQLDQKSQQAYLKKCMEDGQIALFAASLDWLPGGSPLLGECAEMAYEDGDIAFFSVVANHLGQKDLEKWLDLAKEDNRTSFRAMLLNITGRDAEMEEWKADMDRELEAEYAAHDITKDGSAYYYQGQRVRIFLDLRPVDASIVTLSMDPKGTVDVKVLRDSGGNITDVTAPSDAELKELFGEIPYEDCDEEDDWDDFDDWDDGDDSLLDFSQLWPDFDGLWSGMKTGTASGKEADGQGNVVVPVDIARIQGGEAVCLGEYEISHGDRLRYDVEAEAGSAMAVFLAVPGDDSRNVVYCSVTNHRTDGVLRVTSKFTIGEVIHEGPYQLFLYAPEGELAGVEGAVTLSLQKAPALAEESVVRLDLEELPEAVVDAMDACAIRTWYVIPYGGRQYIWHKGFGWSYGWKPEEKDGGWQLDITRLKKKDAGDVFLSVPGGGPVSVLCDGKEVSLTKVQARK